MMRDSYIAVFFLALLNFADAAITTLNIEKYGMETEYNPLMKWVIQHFDYSGMFIVKMFFLALLFYALSKITEEKLRTLVIPSLWFVSGAYTAIVYFGYVVLIQ